MKSATEMKSVADTDRANENKNSLETRDERGAERSREERRKNTEIRCFGCQGGKFDNISLTPLCQLRTNVGLIARTNNTGHQDVLIKIRFNIR